MENKTLHSIFEKEQYNNQANLVYINTLIICGIMSFFYFFTVGSKFVVVLNAAAILVSGISIWLNYQHRYKLSSLVFIGYVTMVATVEIILFGFTSGYQYYFLNMTVLIMFTSWKHWQKLLGAVIEGSIFILLFFILYEKDAVIQLNHNILFFIHTFNVVANIAGVGNSSNYYISIATRNHRKILSLAMKDYLTNLMNRTSFDNYLTETFQLRSFQKQALAILFLDIDFFKRINDTYGHLCGDEILRQFADILAKNVREHDFVARYGGEEFVIIAPMERPEQLEQLSERLRQEVEANSFQFGAQEMRITVSIGAVYIDQSASIDQHQAIDRADKLLYLAKTEGRNRVKIECVNQGT